MTERLAIFAPDELTDKSPDGKVKKGISPDIRFFIKISPGPLLRYYSDGHTTLFPTLFSENLIIPHFFIIKVWCFLCRKSVELYL